MCPQRADPSRNLDTQIILEVDGLRPEGAQDFLAWFMEEAEEAISHLAGREEQYTLRPVSAHADIRETPVEENQ